VRILVLHGPNLNLLGEREPEVYGSQTLQDIGDRLRKLAAAQGAQVETFQSNHEGVLIDRIQEARGSFDAIVINPGGLTHTSVALRDALVEESLLSDVAVGQITGLGAVGYELALRAFLERPGSK
jgi:3-dehydroquinate dehydratase-2